MMDPHASRPVPDAARGFSLVELLVGMTIGLLLVTGVVSVFVGNRQSSDLNAAIASMQESARYALDTIARDVRSAGFQGCLGVQSGATVIQANDAPTASFIASAASGSLVEENDVWNPPPPPTFVAADHDAIPGTHAVSLQFGDPDTYRLRAAMANGAGVPSPSAAVFLDRPIERAAAGDLAIISNCDQADLFAISQIVGGGRNLRHRATHNASGALSAAYGNALTIRQTSVMLFRANVYYVGDTGEDNADGEDVLALFRQSLPFGDPIANPPTEIVAGVENLRVLFGIRESGDNLRYVRPDDAAFDPARVEAVRIGVLMASRDAIAADDDTKTYMLAGQPVPPEGTPVDGGSGLRGETHPVDKRYRLAFNTTVKIRNRRFRP